MTRPRAWRDVNPQFICSHSELREMWRVGRLERPAEMGPQWGWFSASLRLRPDRISDTSGLYLLPCFWYVLLNCCTQKFSMRKEIQIVFSDSLFQAFERQRSLWYRSSESGCPKIDSDSPHIHHLKRHRIHTELQGSLNYPFWGSKQFKCIVNFDKFLL